MSAGTAAVTEHRSNLGDLFNDRRAGDSRCLTEIGADGSVRHHTLAECHDTADAVARGLIARGLEPGARIAIAAANGARFLLAFLGIMRAGFCAVPVNFRLGPAAREHVFRDSGVVLALADADRTAMVPEGTPILRLDDDAQWDALCRPGPFTPQPMAPRDFANILYTSGSTGRPKGVPITHGGFLYALHGAGAAMPQPWDARVLVAAPLYHMNALFWTELALLSGASVVLMSGFDARAYLTAAAEERCTHLSGVPTMIALALRETDLLERLDLSCVQAINVGSAPLSAEMMGEFRRAFPAAAISNGYGTTESGPLAFRPHPDGRPTPWPSLGVASDRVELRLVGGPSADEGTLWVRSPVVTPGYLNLPEKTAERIRDGWYDTGDVMRRDGEGFYYFVGRADDMFTCGGENVYPGEVEALLEAHPAIAQAAVVPVPDRIKGNLPAAFVVPSPGAALDADMVKAHALAHGPAYQHPRFVVIVEALPLSGTNKIDRKPLAEQAATFIRDI